MLRRGYVLLGLTTAARLPVLLTALAAAAWAGLVAWALATDAWASGSAASTGTLIVLVALNGTALLSAAWWLRRQRRQAYLWAVLVLLANAALTLTDQMGWVDTLYLALTLAALAAIAYRTRWYWARAARRERR